ncbi:MAG: TetR/AcrR family transcriptional regulator [Mycobacterium sp.]
MRERDRRDQLIDATLSLCIRCGYEATTVEQIAAAAEVTPADFACYFATKDAALMAVVDDLLQFTATALRHVDVAESPEQALLVATTEVLIAIIDGRGVITRDRMLAMAEIVTAQPSLRRQASSARKRILTRALADRMGVTAENRRERQAVTKWSAVAASAYLDRYSMAAGYDPRQDDQLEDRATANLAATFAQVMG